MAVRIPIPCPQCYTVTPVSPQAIGMMSVCESCGHQFVLRGGGLTVDMGSGNTFNGMAGINHGTVTIQRAPQLPALQEQRQIARQRQGSSYDLRTLEFHCTAAMKPFTSVFAERDGIYAFLHNEKGTGAVYRAAYDAAPKRGLAVDQEPEDESFDTGSFSFAGWSCSWCSSEQIIVCHGHHLCRGGAADLGGGQWRAHCPDCERTITYSGRADAYHGQSTRITRPGSASQVGQTTRQSLQHDSADVIEMPRAGLFSRLFAK